MTDHTQYNLPPMADISHTTDGTITVDTYLQYQSTKQSHTRTDPLADILNNINKNPTAYVTTNAPSNNSHSGQYHEQTNTSQKEANDKNNIIQWQMPTKREKG